LCRRPDNGIRQFDVMGAAQADGTFCNLSIERNDIESAQKAARCNFDIAICANHHLHPRDDTNSSIRVAF
jgi:hypothetical protein